MIPSDITINPLSGYGDSSVDMSMEEYTGRKPLPTREVWVYDADNTTSDMVEVDQYPKEEFIALNDPLSFTMVALGGTVTVTGSSNSASIVPVSFSDQLQFSLEVNGVPQDTWTVDSPGIAGDIGATEQYDFSMTVTVPENRTLEKKTWTFAISNGSHITTAVITIVQDEGVMTYSDIEVSLTYPSVIPASGGSSSPTLTYRQTWGWNGNITNGGVLTSGAEVVYSGDHTNASTGVVTLLSRGTVLGDRLTVVSGVTVSMNGKSTSVQSNVYQEKNIPVEFSVVSDFHYDAGVIPASGGSKSPVLGGYFNITFSSGSVLGNLQAVDAPEGTQIIDTYRSYSMTSAPGFTIDTGNGTVTAENRGTALGAQRSCGDVTSTLNATLVVSVSYADNDTFIRSSSTTLDSPVSQEGNTIESYYESQADLSWPSPIPASGGISDPTGDRIAGAVLTSGSRALLADLRDAGYITYTYHRTLTVTQAAEGLSVVNTDQIQASSRGTVVGNDRTIRFNCDDYYDGSILAEYGGGTVYYKFATLAASVTQSKNIPVSLTSQAGFNYPSGDIPASGGTKYPVLTGFLTVNFSSGGSVTHDYSGSYSGYSISSTTSFSMVAASGFSINTGHGSVTAENRGTTEGERRLSGNVSRTLNWTLTIDSAYGGGTLTSSNSHTEITPVAQAANGVTYGDVTITGGTVSIIPASGGSVSSASGISASQTVSFTSGSSRAGNVSISYGTPVSAESKGTTVSGQTIAGILTATATGEGSKSATKPFTVYQAANTQQDAGISYGTWIVSIRASDFTNPLIEAPAGGGTCTITASASRSVTQNYSYTSGATSQTLIRNETATPSLSASGTGLSVSGTTATWASRGTETGFRTSGTITATYSGISKSVTLYQEANVRTTTYSGVSVTITSVPTIPASGGTVNSGSCTYSQTKTDSYTSGTSNTTTITSGGRVSWSSVTAGSKGTTVSGITSEGTITCTVTLNGKTGTANATCYQEANKVEGYIYEYGEIVLSYPDSITIEAGSVGMAEIRVDMTQDRTPTAVYTSGSELIRPTDTVDLSRYGDGLNSVASSQSWLSVQQTNVDQITYEYSSNPSTEARTAVITFGVNGLEGSGKSASGSINVTQEGESYYLNVSPTSLTFDAAGETKTLTIDTNESWTIS